MNPEFEVENKEIMDESIHPQEKQRLGAPIWHEMFQNDYERELAKKAINAIYQVEHNNVTVEFTCPTRAVAKKFTRILGKAAGKTKCSIKGNEVRYFRGGIMRFVWNSPK